jgi:hypothetical protein
MRITQGRDQGLRDQSDYFFSIARRPDGIGAAAFERTQLFFLALTGLPADPAGMGSWGPRVDAAGLRLAAVAPGMVAAVQRGLLGATDEEAIDLLHRRLLARPATQAEKTTFASWLAFQRNARLGIDGGDFAAARARALADLVLAIESAAQGAEADTLANRLAAAGYATARTGTACTSPPAADWLGEQLARVGDGQDTLVRFKTTLDRRLDCEGD